MKNDRIVIYMSIFIHYTTIVAEIIKAVQQIRQEKLLFFGRCEN